MNKSYWDKRYKKYGDATVTYLNLSRDEILEETNNIKKLVGRQRVLQGKSFNAVLDFGCGVGRCREILEQFCGEWYGSDIVDSLGNRHLDRFIPVVDGKVITSRKFDLIWTCTVLQHVTDIEELKSYLRQFRALTETNGTMICIENIENAENRKHIVFRSSAEYVELFLEAGFTIESYDIYKDMRKEEHGVFILKAIEE